jgi:anti-anti-sigma factor
MGEALTIRVRREQGYPIVAVAGEVDIATVTQLRERLFGLAASGRTLVVDLDQVSFIDSEAGPEALPTLSLPITRCLLTATFLRLSRTE